MLNRELVENFLATYKGNENTLHAWNERLLGKTDQEEWIGLLSRRSVEIRRIYAENMELLDRFWLEVPETPTEEEAELLFGLVLDLYRGGYHDFSTLTRIGERVLPFYEAKGDAGRVLFLSHVLGYEYNNFYRFDQGNDFSVAAGYYRKAIAQQDRYAEIDDPFLRSFLIRDYANLFFAHPEEEVPDLEECFRIDRAMWDFWNRPEVQRLDGDNPMFPAILARIDASTLEEMAFQLGPDLPWPDQGRGLVERIGREYEGVERAALPLNDLISCLYCEYLNGETTRQELMEQVMERFLGSAPRIDYAKRSMGEFGMLAEYLSIADELLSQLEHLDFPLEERRDYARRFLPQVIELVSAIPYPYFPEVLNQNISQIYMDAQPYMEGEQEKIDGVLHLIVRRQPITYIHSMMVTEIAKLLLWEVFSRCPEELVGILGCETREEVLDRRRELTRYVETCGLLHDVGKCDITDVINRQNRSLTDAEFLMIRNHPGLGPVILNHAPELEKYFDVILGHHRTYDGKGGYPADFDNTASPVRFIIDLISIADSTDAATDILGRNYAKGKDFSRLFEELKAGAGTRYNPRIVRLIEESPQLQARLAQITSEGRYEVYYRAYRDITGET